MATRPPDFVEALGPAFLAHRFRRLSERFVDGAQARAADWGVLAPMRSGSTFVLLAAEPGLGITEIAQRLKLSHPLIIDLLVQLERLEFVRFESDPGDRRRRRVFLTDAGLAEADRRLELHAQMIAAYAQLSAEVGVDLAALMDRLDEALAREPFADRVGVPDHALEEA